MKFSENFTVNSHLCDANGIARPTAIVSFLQEAANIQLRTYGPSGEELRANGQAFVLSRIGVGIYAPIRAYHTYTMQTWSCESRGFSFYRCHRLLDGDEVLAEAVSVWALINIVNKKPLRTTEFHPNFDHEEILDFEVPSRIRITAEALREAGYHTVRYSETDINRHMNNTVYADMLCNFIDMTDRRASRININYFNEAPLGEKLTVYLEEAEDGIYRFRTLREDGKINVEAEIRLAAI